jgi:hypothetical protein
MALSEPPPRESRFGSPLKMSKVDWVRREMVVEVSYGRRIGSRGTLLISENVRTNRQSTSAEALPG